MGFRFRRRIGLAPGLTLNLSKSGGSLTLGPRGSRVTVGPRGVSRTMGIPGTGISYTAQVSGRSTKPSRHRSVATQSNLLKQYEPKSPKRLSLGFIQRLFKSSEECAFVDDLKALVEGDEPTALLCLKNAVTLPDAAWLAGLFLLQKQRPDEAQPHLEFALRNALSLGRLFDKYGVAAAVSLGITPELKVEVPANERGTLLALIELYQHQHRQEDAANCVERLLALDPSDPVALLSAVELMLDDEDEQAARAVIELTEDVQNESPIHTAILLYKGRALMRLGLNEAALKTFTTALRRKKDRPETLLHQLLYDRALTYDALGRKTSYERELERIYAEAPDFMDVAKRLEL